MGENKEPEKKKEEQPSFFLVVLQDDADAPPQVHRSDSAQAFSSLVSEHVLSATQPLYAFAFKGERIQIGAPNAVCTVDIAGEKVTIGEQLSRFEESGRIVPLKNADK